jgi:pyrimidine operon attenuation protein/uracil phosphoribosyltransferase
MRGAYNEADVQELVQRLVDKIAGDFPRDQGLNIVGIRTRGEVLAERLTQQLRDRGFTCIGRGVLDITLYRDDLSEIGPRPMVRPTQLKIQIDDIPLILVDDVLFTGRSVRAALNALIDFGRPSAIRLAVLVDRGGRELPIQPDYAALRVTDVPHDHRVKVRLRETDGADEILIEHMG